MRFQLASDLHLWADGPQFEQLVIPVPGVQALVLCGDIASPFSALYADALAYAAAHWPHVILVTGNNEYYNVPATPLTRRPSASDTPIAAGKAAKAVVAVAAPVSSSATTAAVMAVGKAVTAVAAAAAAAAAADVVPASAESRSPPAAAAPASAFVGAPTAGEVIDSPASDSPAAEASSRRSSVNGAAAVSPVRAVLHSLLGRTGSSTYAAESAAATAADVSFGRWTSGSESTLDLTMARVSAPSSTVELAPAEAPSMPDLQISSGAGAAMGGKPLWSPTPSHHPHRLSNGHSHLLYNSNDRALSSDPSVPPWAQHSTAAPAAAPQPGEASTTSYDTQVHVHASSSTSDHHFQHTASPARTRTQSPPNTASHLQRVASTSAPPSRTASPFDSAPELDPPDAIPPPPPLSRLAQPPSSSSAAATPADEPSHGPPPSAPINRPADPAAGSGGSGGSGGGAHAVIVGGAPSQTEATPSQTDTGMTDGGAATHAANMAATAGGAAGMAAAATTVPASKTAGGKELFEAEPLTSPSTAAAIRSASVNSVPLLTHHTMADVDARVAQLASRYGNVTFLNNSVMELDGVTFIGSTLWTWVPPEHRKLLAGFMLEYKLALAAPNVRLTPAHTSSLFTANVAFIRSATAAATAAGRRAVVLTHHVPTPHDTSSPAFAGKPTTSGFSSDLEDLLDSGSIDVWCCGHTHHNFRQEWGRAAAAEHAAQTSVSERDANMGGMTVVSADKGRVASGGGIGVTRLISNQYGHRKPSAGFETGFVVQV